MLFFGEIKPISPILISKGRKFTEKIKPGCFQFMSFYMRLRLKLKRFLFLSFYMRLGFQLKKLRVRMQSQMGKLTTLLVPLFFQNLDNKKGALNYKCIQEDNGIKLKHFSLSLMVNHLIQN